MMITAISILETKFYILSNSYNSAGEILLLFFDKWGKWRSRRWNDLLTAMSLGHTGPKIETHQVCFVQRKSHMCWTVMLLISQVTSIVCISSFFSRLFSPLVQTFITSYFNSWNNSSTGFCNSKISILKSQTKPLWSCPFLVQKPPKVPHCREVGFPAGWSQTFARWIIKPHYHIVGFLLSTVVDSYIWNAQGGLPCQSLTCISNAPD